MALESPIGWAEQPAGMRDVYPKQAKRRRELENGLIDFFEQNGYQLVSSGAFEYVDTLLRGRRPGEAEDWVRLFDASGRAVALRPDMTPSIARMAAPLVAAGANDIRWCYAERVYRRSSEPATLSWAGGKAAESTQVGVEWIGPTGPETDARLLGLCQLAVNELGLDNWQIVIGHAVFGPAVMQLYGVQADEVGPLLNCLVVGDYVGFRTLQEQLGIREDVLRILSSIDPLRPDTLPAAMVDSWERHPAGPAARAAWMELVSIAGALRELDLADRISFDFTLCRDLSYYTGIMFEVFVPGVGAPVALGGRYDELLLHFGASAPAIGFTFEVERLLTALSDDRWVVGAGGKGRSR